MLNDELRNAESRVVALATYVPRLFTVAEVI
jgi:hypothetical protein